VSWDLAARTVTRMEGHAGAILALAVSKDGTRLFSGGEDLRILGWDLSTGAKLPWIANFPSEILALALSSDGTRLYAAGRTATVHVISTADGSEIVSRDLSPSKDRPALGFSSLVLSPDDATLYVGGSGGVQAVKADDLTHIATFAGPTKDVLCLARSADGAWLMAGDADNGIWLWSKDCHQCHAWSSGPGAHSGPVKAVALIALDAPPGAPAPDKPPGDGEGGDKPADKPPGDAPQDGGGGTPPADGAPPPEKPSDGTPPGSGEPAPEGPPSPPK
jgi:WD40 repeat protein